MPSANDQFVFIMPANPKPNQLRFCLHGDGPIMNADACRPKPANFFEMQRGMLRFLLEQRKILIGEFLNVGGKLLIKPPELRVRAVPHKSVERPSRKSRNASSASVSRRPAAASCSNCRSHASASNSENQARKVERSSRESLLTADSISLTLLMPEKCYCVPTDCQFARRGGNDEMAMMGACPRRRRDK
jgi:hypothetical protein